MQAWWHDAPVAPAKIATQLSGAQKKKQREESLVKDDNIMGLLSCSRVKPCFTRRRPEFCPLFPFARRLHKHVPWPDSCYKFSNPFGLRSCDQRYAPFAGESFKAEAATQTPPLASTPVSRASSIAFSTKENRGEYDVGSHLLAQTLNLPRLEPFRAWLEGGELPIGLIDELVNDPRSARQVEKAPPVAKKASEIMAFKKKKAEKRIEKI